MNEIQQADWKQVRTRGRADFALRYGVKIGLVFWGIHSVTRSWGGWRELVLSLPFFLCIFVASYWFILWPWRERDFQRVDQATEQTQHDDTAAEQ